MSASSEDVRKSVLAAVETFNADGDGAVPASLDAVLLGEGGVVDSMGLVRLVLMVEQRVQDDFGVAVSLTDEKALSQRNSPFRNLGTLADYVTACLNEPA